MSSEYITIAAYCILPTLPALVAYFMKNLIGRIDMLENKMHEKLDEPEVRQLLSDKLDPIKEDIAEIKGTVQKLFDLHIASYNRGE